MRERLQVLVDTGLAPTADPTSPILTDSWFHAWLDADAPTKAHAARLLTRPSYRDLDCCGDAVIRSTKGFAPVGAWFVVAVGAAADGEASCRKWREIAQQFDAPNPVDVLTAAIRIDRARVRSLAAGGDVAGEIGEFFGVVAAWQSIQLGELDLPFPNGKVARSFLSDPTLRGARRRAIRRCPILDSPERPPAAFDWTGDVPRGLAALACEWAGAVVHRRDLPLSGSVQEKLLELCRRVEQDPDCGRAPFEEWLQSLECSPNREIQNDQS